MVECRKWRNGEMVEPFRHFTFLRLRLKWDCRCLGCTGRMVVGVWDGKLQTEETNGKEIGCGMREIVMGGLGFG